MTIFTELSHLLLPLLLFTFLATATPGPNNVLLTLSGSQFGYKKTLPFIVGIRVGIGFLFLLMSLGIGALILANPTWYLILKIMGASYLVYLAIKIAFSNTKNNKQKTARLLGFKHGALMQFVNPKSMMMVLSCITAFSLPGELYTPSVVQAFVIFTLVGMVSNSCWVLFGVAINKLLATEKSQLLFNRMLALLTLCAVVLLFV
jgi:threonine/homoserine/homoserine lactone efflux protein